MDGGDCNLTRVSILADTVKNLVQRVCPERNAGWVFVTAFLRAVS